MAHNVLPHYVDEAENKECCLRDVACNEECEECFPIFKSDAFVEQCAVVVEIGDTLIAFGAVRGQRWS